jgi:divalent metal cation (Fe/Co/Zn/Cd) transporter
VRFAALTPAARLAVGSVAVALAVLGLKLAAWWLTGSLALWSDALESLVNVAASLAALLAVRLADKPADREHPYGHACPGSPRRGLGSTRSPARSTPSGAPC